jgi:periplasmic divalent cation tolerance protein
MMTDKKLVLTTTGSREEAQRIARGLLDAHAAACVNIVGPVESIYRWQGAVETASEWLLIIKTTADGFTNVQTTIKELHSYDLPECIQIPIEDGSAGYLQWIGEQVKK